MSGNSRSNPSGPQPSKDLFLPRADHPFADQRTSSYRPAGLDDRYAHFEVEAEDHTSPVAQFRRDPVGFIRTCGYLWTDGDPTLERFADYTALVDAEAVRLGGMEHTSAWADVRTKAMRLRHEGKVAVHDIAHNRIYATVEGDHGTYDVMLSKSGALGNSQSVADWACSCDWGRWAFKRQMTYIGRLCSHAYAAYLDMQSQYLKDNPQHFDKVATASVEDYKSWLQDNYQVPEASSVANYLNTQANDADKDGVEKLYNYISDNPEQSPERDFKAPYTSDPDEAYKTADLLRQKPLSLTPNLHEVPEGEGQQWMDVLKDERETTAPDQIVHFSALDTMRSLHGASEGITDFASPDAGMGGAAPAPTPAPSATSAPDMPDADAGGGAIGINPSGSSEFGGTGSAVPPTPDTGGGAIGINPSGSTEFGGNGTMASRHYAEASDESLLEKLRDMSTTPAADDAGHMDAHNDELRDVTDELNDRGYDASFMVAMYRDAGEVESPSDGKGDFLGQSSPGFPDQGFNGSGPNPKDWMSDSAGYVEENQDPHVEKDWSDLGNEDIIKFNDSRSKPQQGPRHSYRQADNFSDGAGFSGSPGSDSQMAPEPGLGAGPLDTPDSGFDTNQTLASLHTADDSGFFNPNNAGDEDWQAGSGEDFANELGNDVKQTSDSINPAKMLSGGGEEGGAAEGEAGAAGGEAGAGAAAGGEASELAPLLLAASNDFDPAAAFDRGEFSFGDAPGGGGELRRAQRLGNGPTQAVRVDPGGRGWAQQRQAAAPPPEDFGFDGVSDMAAYETGDPTGSDILAAFQRSAAAQDIMQGGGGSAPAGSSNDFSSSPFVQSFLRTAGRVYTADEQRELENESHPLGARNLPTPQDLAGTHYV